jgi:hypothetical protein
MELSFEEIDAQLGETVPERTLMSIVGTSPTSAAMPAVPSDISNGPVDYTKFLEFDPLSSTNL